MTLSFFLISNPGLVKTKTANQNLLKRFPLPSQFMSFTDSEEDVWFFSESNYSSTISMFAVANSKDVPEIYSKTWMFIYVLNKEWFT